MSNLIERPNAKHFNFTIGIDEDGILYVPFREVVDNIQSFQTVNAIPVEWLKERYKIEGYYGTDTYFRKAYAVREIIADWEAQRVKKNDHT